MIFPWKLIFLAFLGQKLKKWAVCESGFFSILPIFFDRIKSIENTKKLSPQMIGVCRKKFPPFQKKKWIFGHFCDFAKKISFSILFNSIKKNGQNRKKLTFAHSPFFQFLTQKCQKYQFSWKNLFLGIFLWVISVRKGFLYFWQTTIFEPTRVILLRRVWYQPFRLKFWVPYPPQQNGSSGFKYRCLSKV